MTCPPPRSSDVDSDAGSEADDKIAKLAPNKRNALGKKDKEPRSPEEIKFIAKAIEMNKELMEHFNFSIEHLEDLAANADKRHIEQGKAVINIGDVDCVHFFIVALFFRELFTL